MFAELGNRVIRITETQVEAYSSKGYIIKDDNGTVLKNTVPNDILAMQDTIARLTKENAELKAQLATKAVVADEPVVEAPKKTSTRKAKLVD